MASTREKAAGSTAYPHQLDAGLAIPNRNGWKTNRPHPIASKAGKGPGSNT
jgi:hypothetical protein